MIAALALVAGFLLSQRATQDSTSATKTIVDRRAVTLDALNAFQQQQRCVALLDRDQKVIQTDVDDAVGDIVLAERDTAALQAARQRFAQLKQREVEFQSRLATLEKDCFDRFPIPQPDDQPPG